MPVPRESAPVVVVDVDRVALEDETVAHLLRWVDAGGVLVLFGAPAIGRGARRRPGAPRERAGQSEQSRESRQPRRDLGEGLRARCAHRHPSGDTVAGLRARRLHGKERVCCTYHTQKGRCFGRCRHRALHQRRHRAVRQRCRLRGAHRHRDEHATRSRRSSRSRTHRGRAQARGAHRTQRKTASRPPTIRSPR